MFKNKNIIITGGTGSFGKKFVEVFLKKFKPKKLIIYSRDELKQYEMKIHFSKYKNLRFFLGDVRDKDRLRFAFREVDYVVHAAALKQVDTAEYNPMECLKTNVNGAENVIDACLHNKVKKVIALSTDKAVNPINLYGVTKLASDKLFISANLLSGNLGTKFSVVRYGNVVGSRGSVLPLFKKLVMQNKNVLPITNKDMTRFWITLNEGVNFVLKSFNRMIGGEIFIPIIPSIKITDLAKSMGKNIKVKIVGVRPGEKIHELLCSEDESQNVRKMGNHLVIVPNYFKYSKKSDYKDMEGNVGKKVSKSFQYSSGKNKKFLNINEIKKLNNKINL